MHTCLVSSSSVGGEGVYFVIKVGHWQVMALKDKLLVTTYVRNTISQSNLRDRVFSLEEMHESDNTLGMCTFMLLIPVLSMNVGCPRHPLMV